MTGDQRAMYTGICMCRNTEVQLRWTRSQMFIAIHTAAVAFLGTQEISRLYVIVGAAGVPLAGAWMLINHLSQKWVDYWQSRLVQIEPHLDPGTISIFSGPAWNAINRWPRSYPFLNVLACFVLLMWIVVIIAGATIPQ